MSLCIETGKNLSQARREKIEILHHHIVVEGPIGVGKTSLAIKLAEKIKGIKMIKSGIRYYVPFGSKERAV